MVAIEAIDREKISPYENVAIGLQCQGRDQAIRAVARIKGPIQRAVGVDARNSVAEERVISRKSPADQDALIGLNRHGKNGGISARNRVIGRFCVRVETGLQSAGGLIMVVKKNRNGTLVDFAHAAILGVDIRKFD